MKETRHFSAASSFLLKVESSLDSTLRQLHHISKNKFAFFQFDRFVL